MSAKFEEDTGNLKDMKFTSPTEEARTQVEKLKAKGVDAIIVIAHMGIDNENKIPDTGMRDVINAVDGIDVVIAGHMHKDVPSETIKIPLSLNHTVTVPWYLKWISLLISTIKRSEIGEERIQNRSS